jgi:hypothetical protein
MTPVKKSSRVVLPVTDPVTDSVTDRARALTLENLLNGSRGGKEVENMHPRPRLQQEAEWSD